MFIFYILTCDNNIYYTGITNDINKRFKEHLLHESFYTKRFSKIELVFTEEFLSREEAAIREKQIKGWSNAKKAALIKGNILKLKELSKRRKK